ncbi:MAG: leucyl/phenylalanyl-tRNA--protein transferase, partial [Nitrospirae bacterium]|nr:leucyl/phenylalanyl-tRNA--protein transferase [Nitrospirota bacterium]
MPVFQLSKKNVFPPPELAEYDGLLAIGGDLTVKRLLNAYAMGIFPWYSEGSPILWWSPDPRMILLPDELIVSRSLRQTIRKGIFHVTFDTDFEEVIKSCASVSRKDANGTWITDEMREAYVKLHESGYAHSIESRIDGNIVGGLYGVSLGGAFFGESMFSRVSNASKVAFVSLVNMVKAWDFLFVDCQVTTEYLMSFGARHVSRKEFMELIDKALLMPAHKGRWT